MVLKDSAKNNRLVYVGYYDVDGDVPDRRDCVRAATTKMDYIAKKAREAGYRVDILSAARCDKRLPSRCRSLPDGDTLRLLPCMRRGARVARAFDDAVVSWNVLRALSHLGAGDTVLCYHSLGYARAIAQARRRFGFRLILEVEEFYADVSGKPRHRAVERCVFDAADAFICASDPLADLLSSRGKPTLVCSGIYESKRCLSDKYDDGLVHIVYAGNMHPLKGGAHNAVLAAEYLPAEYRMHILGPEEPDRPGEIQALIRRVNDRSRGCVVSYDGCLSGEACDAAVQRCEIGLNPQRQDGMFNRSSFPSKVFSYLANGLCVVSTDLPVFRSPCIRDALFLCDSDEPSCIAEGILRARAAGAPHAGILEKLDRQFASEFARLLAAVDYREWGTSL